MSDQEPRGASSGDYEIGYGKPPKHSRFKKGQSGNRKGRPKGSRNFRTDVKKTLNEPVRLTKDGKRKSVSTQHAALMRLREKALSGDARSLDRLLELARNYNDEEFAEAASALSATDQEILDAFKRRVRGEPAASWADDDDEKAAGDASGDSADGRDETLGEEDDDAWLK